MGQYYDDAQHDITFPDEFGEDICRPEGRRPNPAVPARLKPRPFCGYVTNTWFGPFLLSPPTQRRRGLC